MAMRAKGIEVRLRPQRQRRICKLMESHTNLDGERWWKIDIDGPCQQERSLGIWYLLEDMLVRRLERTFMDEGLL